MWLNYVHFLPSDLCFSLKAETGLWTVPPALPKGFIFPEILIGATVVSIGTTLPEVMVSATSAVWGHSEIAYRERRSAR